MLRAINELMTVRIKQRMAFSAQISSARYTAMFTASLPYLLIPLIYSQEKTWFEPVIEQRAGMTVLIVALGLQLLGFYWLHKISRSYQ
jgi:Flp pilus assembly protein TadB